MKEKDEKFPDLVEIDILEDDSEDFKIPIESLSGGTNAAGAIGNGKLTVGISPWSELIYFRWPTLSVYDHLRYFTESQGLKGWLSPKDVRWGKDAPSLDWRKYGRPYEVYPGLGAKGGLYFGDGSLNWFDNKIWTSRRRYVPDNGPILCTQLQGNDAQIEVCQWVDWDSDLLVQQFQIQAASAEKFFYYGTFAPSNSLERGWGKPDSKKNGFAAVYFLDQSIIIYFLPNVRKKERLAPQLDLQLSPELIDELYPEGGIFISMGMLSPADGFQVGADRRGRRISKNAPLGACKNAQAGKLDGNRGFIGPIDAGLERILKKDNTEVTILIAIDVTAVGSMKAILEVRKQGLDVFKGKIIKWWESLANQVNLPPQAKLEEKRLSYRGISNLFIGRDRGSGAIVAAPTRQPAYHYDWPRDGAFIDLALDIAGFPEVVDQHLDFYRRMQRKNRLSFSLAWLLKFKCPFYLPRGHWHSNLYADGKKGALFIIPFEIDETALLIWDLWRHELFIKETDRSAYQKVSLETLQLAANAIERYVNRHKGWIKHGFEDDNIIPQASLHGAAAILTGLAAAVDAGRRWGVDSILTNRWNTSAMALRNGILRKIEDKSIFKKIGWRGNRWALFPAPVFESYDDPRAELLINELEEDIQNKISKKFLISNYLGERVFILGIVSSKLHRIRRLIERAVDLLVNEMPINGSDCYGEVNLWIKMPERAKRIAQQRVSIPHLWTGICTYLAVESLYRPDRFLTQIPPIPE